MATSAVIYDPVDCLKDLSQCEMFTTEANTAVQASLQYTDSAAQDHPASTTSSEKQRLANIIRSVYITIREYQEAGPREFCVFFSFRVGLILTLDSLVLA